MRAVNEIRLALLGQRGHLFAWAPVFLGVGIGLYFLLRREPPVAALWGAGIGAMCLGAAALRGGAVSGPLLWALALLVAGFALAGARAHAVAGPVLTWRYYGPVEGTVVGIDRSASDAVRLTLADVVLKGVAPADTPRKRTTTRKTAASRKKAAPATPVEDSPPSTRSWKSTSP